MLAIGFSVGGYREVSLSNDIVAFEAFVADGV